METLQEILDVYKEGQEAIRQGRDLVFRAKHEAIALCIKNNYHHCLDINWKRLHASYHRID